MIGRVFKMENRLRMQNEKQFIEQMDTPTGKQFLQELRKSNPEFKGKRINSVLQAYPSLIQIGVLLDKQAIDIAEHKSQKPVKNFTITIEWARSRVWGSNPHATAKVEHQDGKYSDTGSHTASGCGYCKESTVIAAIFNDLLRYKLYDIPEVNRDKGNKAAKGKS